MEDRLKRIMNPFLLASAIISLGSALAFITYIVFMAFHLHANIGLLMFLFQCGVVLGVIAQIFQILSTISLIFTWWRSNHEEKKVKEPIMLILALIPYVALLLTVFILILYLRERRKDEEKLHELRENLTDGTQQLAEKKATAMTPQIHTLNRVVTNVVGPVSAGVIATASAHILSTLTTATLVTTLATGATVATGAATTIIHTYNTSPVATVVAPPRAPNVAVVSPTPNPPFYSPTVAPTIAPTIVPAAVSIMTPTVTIIPTATQPPHVAPTSTPTRRVAPTSTPTPIPPPPVNLLQNPSFTSVYPAGDTGGQCTGPGAPAPFFGGGIGSAAANWNLYNNILAVTSTNLVASTRTTGKTMLHVCTMSHDNGLVQVFAAQPNGGPAHVVASAWVFVITGTVGMGSGNGGNSPGTAFSQTTGKWEYLQTANGVSPANEIILYNVNPAGGEFYVDMASIHPTG